MNGKSPIVVNINNSYQFHEHATLESAKREAHRLASTVRGGKFVVYAPVAIVTKAPETVEDVVMPQSMIEKFRPEVRFFEVTREDDDLPF